MSATWHECGHTRESHPTAHAPPAASQQKALIPRHMRLPPHPTTRYTCSSTRVHGLTRVAVLLPLTLLSSCRLLSRAMRNRWQPASRHEVASLAAAGGPLLEADTRWRVSRQQEVRAPRPAAMALIAWRQRVISHATRQTMHPRAPHGMSADTRERAIPQRTLHIVATRPGNRPPARGNQPPSRSRDPAHAHAEISPHHTVHAHAEISPHHTRSCP